MFWRASLIAPLYHRKQPIRRQLRGAAVRYARAREFFKDDVYSQILVRSVLWAPTCGTQYVIGMHWGPD